MSSRIERQLAARGLVLDVREAPHAEYEPVPSWTIFVKSPSLPAEPIYVPPIGLGRGAIRALAVKEAVENYRTKEAELSPEARMYFERALGAPLPRLP